MSPPISLDVPDPRLEGLEQLTPGFVYAPAPGGRPTPAVLLRWIAVATASAALGYLPLTVLYAYVGAMSVAAPIVLALGAYYMLGAIAAIDLGEATSRGELDRVTRGAGSWLLWPHGAARYGFQAIVAIVREQYQDALPLVRKATRSLTIRSSPAAQRSWRLVEVRTLAGCGELAAARRLLADSGPRPEKGVLLHAHVGAELLIHFLARDPSIDGELLALACALGRRSGMSDGLLTACAWATEARADRADRAETRQLLIDELAKPEPQPLGRALGDWRSDAMARLGVPTPASRPAIEPSPARPTQLHFIALAVGLAYALMRALQ